MISTHRRKHNLGVYDKTKMIYCIKLMKLYLAYFDLSGHLRPLEAILQLLQYLLYCCACPHHSVHLAAENILLGMIGVHFFIFISIKLEVS